MATIIDKRKSGKNKSAENRARFVKRYKKNIKEAINTSDSITKPIDQRKVKLKKKDLKEPSFQLDPKTGKSKRVHPGNKQYAVGDKIRKDSSTSKRQGRAASNSDDDLIDEFTFVLSKDEFMDLYFEDMELPDFIKESMKDNIKYKLSRAGYSKEGTPPRLDLLKTFKQSIARRKATGSTRFLDDIDLRYKHFIQKPYPIKQAHLFFLMDVSGSMEAYEKDLAKRFFMLLYLFVNREYEKVDVTFVRHTTQAKVCTEEEFFYSKESGGTVVSSGLELVNKLIDEEVDLNSTNVYLAQASDGDNWTGDEEDTAKLLKEIHEKVQYIAYIQTEDIERAMYKEKYKIEDLFDLYAILQEYLPKLNIQHVISAGDVFPVFKQLFGKRD